MEDLINRLSRQKSSPRLWIERLAIFSEAKVDQCIRSISFRRGLNVIWAHEPASGTHTGIHAAGHGVGKTSLCLLIRYCLGDNAKLVIGLRDELAREFPYGGVGVVVHIEDQTYSIFRFFNAYKDGVVTVGSDIESLIGTSSGQSFKEFETQLATTMMSKVSPRNIPETDQTIEWRHVLSWITRDQGARFKSFFAWREEEGTGLRRPRQDPPIVMRAVLGLMEHEESELMVRIHSLEKDLKRSQQETERLQKEPQLIRLRIESELRAWLQVADDLPLRSDDIFKDSVEDKVNEAKQQAQAKLEEINSRYQALNQQLAEFRAELILKKRDYDEADEVYQFAQAAINRDENTLKQFASHRETLQGLCGPCQHGGVLFRDCTHIQDEIKKLGAISLKDHRDQNLLGKSLDAWLDSAMKALESKKVVDKTMESIRGQMASLEQQCNALSIKRDSAVLEVDRGSRLLRELERWQKLFGSAETAESIRQSMALSEKITNNIGFAGVKLQLCQQERTKRQRGLGDLMNGLVNNLFSDETVGNFVVRDEYRPFQLSVNGGEAYYVLEVLLGDLACLLDCADPGSAFPGLLIHDCPREADMSPLLYEKLLSLVQHIEQKAYGTEAPFQYIVTTTSPPPSPLRDMPFLRETLDPSTDDGLLFRRRFQSTPQNIK
ncbi:hypothetical protein A1353_14315 [Methylomonas methanica]|uniref:Uncharacterized protein n=1 Tax=Methylomonas methanica TaxID=421 RepID=A0A177MDA4_METMH|nr:hypothetical protein [Methylomonas methanica]OAI03718.1 hypothetical protein A1353_14315 [Methylomonas methanica]